MIEGSVKRACFLALDRLGVIATSEMFANGVAVLAYHGVTDSAESCLSNIRRLHVPKALFEEHLTLLATRWRPIPLSALSEAMKAKQTLPPRSVVVTFDDGYRNNRTTVLSLLKQFGIPATVFVLAGREREERMWIDRVEAAIVKTAVSQLRWQQRLLALTSAEEKKVAIGVLVRELRGLGADRERMIRALCTSLGDPPGEADPDRDLLNWDEIRELRDAGLEIGSHSDYHEPMTSRTLEDARSALTESREVLERQLGRGNYAFSYPYGAWSPEVARLAQEAGFSCAVTTDPGLNRVGGELFRLKRFLIGADDDVCRVRASMSGLRTLWSLPSAGGLFRASRPKS
jgi:peptidoglycan/xylan/chitin deacetylase (PgdA/CDA1 family)